MSEWKVATGTYDAATNLALDEELLERAGETGDRYLRVFGFERPALILARNQSYEDIKEVREDIEYTRRLSGGYAMYCDDNAIFYSIAMPAEETFPEDIHEEVLGPRIAQAVIDMGVPEDRVGIGEHFSVRIDGRTVAGNGQRKTQDAVLYHGVLAIDPWDTETLEDILVLKEHEGESERSYIEQLPALSEEIEDPPSDLYQEAGETLIETVTGGDYERIDLDPYQDRIRDRIESRYRDRAWIEADDLVQDIETGKGFCFVNWDEEVRGYV